MLGLLRICVIALKERCSTIKYRKTLSLKRRPRGEVHVHAGSVFRVLLIFSPLNARFFWLFVITFPRFLPRLHFFRGDFTDSLAHSLTPGPHFPQICAACCSYFLRLLRPHSKFGLNKCNALTNLLLFRRNIESLHFVSVFSLTYSSEGKDAEGE